MASYGRKFRGAERMCGRLALGRCLAVGVEPATDWPQVRRPNHQAVETYKPGQLGHPQPEKNLTATYLCYVMKASGGG